MDFGIARPRGCNRIEIGQSLAGSADLPEKQRPVVARVLMGRRCGERCAVGGECGVALPASGEEIRVIAENLRVPRRQLQSRFERGPGSDRIAHAPLDHRKQVEHRRVAAGDPADRDQVGARLGEAPGEEGLLGAREEAVDVDGLHRGRDWPRSRPPV